MELIKPATFKHFCNPGDLVASMAAIRAYYESTNRKVLLCQQKNVEANYYPGARHGTVSDGDGHTMVCMNTKMFDMIKPLVESQQYIHGMEEYVGQEILVDLDTIRKETFVNLPHGMIQSWPMFAYPDLAYDLSKPWIDLPDNKEIEDKMLPQVKGKIILNFTERYRNGHINYFFLRKYKHDLVFAGTDIEHLLFMNKWKMDMPKLKIDNFLELAYGIKHCKFILCNQSMSWNIAEAIKSPRVLEICEYANNCMSFVGDKSYGFYHQSGVEYYVNLLV